MYKCYEFKLMLVYLTSVLTEVFQRTI